MSNWIQQIERNTNEFVEAFGALSAEQLNWKPNAKTWSIAQNIDHIIVINETYFPVIESIKRGNYKAPFIARINFLVSLMGKTVLNAVGPDRKRKMKTFPIWEPDSSKIPADILERFRKHQSVLMQCIQDSADLVDRGIVISSPANRNIVYSLDKAFDIIVAHEKRHFVQAKELYDLMVSENH
ncbi:MAG: DinB family protein [Bacteroidetes bacterium]|nr:DinB family protein [Bacteroidota bacterium]